VSALWVAGIQISARIAEKINSKHDITPDDVFDAIVCVEDLDYVHSYSETRGWRWLVRVQIQGHDDDFFEEDERVEDLLAEFDRATERGKTRRPARGQTQWLTILGMASDSDRETMHRTPNTLNFFAT